MLHANLDTLFGAVCALILCIYSVGNKILKTLVSINVDIVRMDQNAHNTFLRNGNVMEKIYDSIQNLEYSVHDINRKIEEPYKPPSEPSF